MTSDNFLGEKPPMTIEIQPIRSEQGYEWALQEIEHYFDQEPKPNSPEAARFDALAAQIQAYEAVHWPISGS